MTLNTLKALQDALNVWLQSKPFNCVIEERANDDEIELWLFFDNPVTNERAGLPLDISSEKYQKRLDTQTIEMCLEREKSYIKVLISEAVWS